MTENTEGKRDGKNRNDTTDDSEEAIAGTAKQMM